jgi:hypothetical protein
VALLPMPSRVSPSEAVAERECVRRTLWTGLTVEQVFFRVRIAIAWSAAIAALVLGAGLVLALFDEVGVIWSCQVRLGTVGGALAWIALVHHVLGMMWLALILSYPRRYVGRRRRGYTSLALVVYLVVVLWVVATSC